MKTIILLIILSVVFAQAAEIEGSFSSGFYWGTPYWNADNYGDDKVIESDDPFLRSVNHLRLRGQFFDNFSLRLHALRNDGFQSENRLSETKIYEVLAQYDFSKGLLKAGRFVPLNRWIRGSVDGGGLAYAITEKIKFSALGGLYSPYGKIYDSDKTLGLGYADLALRYKKYGAKLKIYADEDVTKAGGDFFGTWKKLSFSGNYGFDLSNERIADGGLNLLYPISSKFSASINYRLFRTDDWKLVYIDFPSRLVERYSLGLRYKVFNNYYLDFRQMLSMTSDTNDYLTYLNFSGKYFYLGVNYLSGDSKFERLGLLIGGKYTLFQDLQLSAGIAPVDYLLPEEDDHLQTIAYYFRAQYKLWKSIVIAANFNFYQDNEALESSSRGGIQIRYNFGS